MAIDIPGITFLEKHERLLIVLAVLAAGLWAWGRGLSTFEKYQENKASKLEQQLQQTQQQTAAAQQAAADAKAQVAASQTAAAADKAASAAIIQALSAQNAQLTKNIIDRDKQTQAQQKTDLSASIPELGKRFVQLVPDINPADIKVADDQKSVAIGQDTAQKTVAQLELVPQLQADNKDLQEQIDNSSRETDAVQKALDSETKYAEVEANLVTQQDKVLGLLQKQIDQGDKVCEAKVAVERAKGKKSFLKGLKVGAVLGFIGGLFVGHGGI